MHNGSTLMYPQGFPLPLQHCSLLGDLMSVKKLKHWNSPHLRLWDSLDNKNDALLLYRTSNLTNNCTAHNSCITSHQLDTLPPEEIIRYVLHSFYIHVKATLHLYHSCKWLYRAQLSCYSCYRHASNIYSRLLKDATHNKGNCLHKLQKSVIQINSDV